jgi:energy-coupling factor transporter ATP-binding protein EcfA2
MLKLQWLQIHKFRSVKPGTRLVFNPKFNVLLGQNGTGKTTLLNLVAAVVGSNFKGLREEEYELEYELAADAGRIQVKVRNARPDTRVSLREPFRPGMVFTLRDMEAPRFSAEIKGVAHDGSPTFTLSVEGTRMTVKHGRDGSAHIGEFDLLNEGEQLWAVLAMGVFQWLKASHGEGGTTTYVSYGELWIEESLRRFDESLGYFDQLKDARFRLIRLNTRGETHALGGMGPPVLIRELVSQARLNAGAKSHALTSDTLPFLDEVTQLLGFKSAEAIVELLQSNLNGDAEVLEFGGLRFLFVRPSGSRISEQHLSYGQKRMLAFMYYQATARSVVIADELVNGLHHRWIRACLEVLGERQVFLTSQNPLLLDYLTFDSPEQVRSTFVLSNWEEEGGGQMVWEDMSQEVAEDFFASYKVGFQQVGELLQSKGLW